jgi:PIN domain nuclease of toxin-antitoxin system
LKALLDTHALLWWVTGDPRLSDAARDAILSAVVAVSVVSLWEIEIKRGLGRIEIWS